MEPVVYPPDVPGYRLERLIGEGGFGQVWRAHRGTDERLVAIKILHLELVRSVDAMRRFERELDAIGRLHHPHVVRAEGHGHLPDGRPFVVLEYVDGPSLREVLHERGALPPTEVLAILGPLCEALAVAHAAGLVHRDVKASNVILERHARALRPVLLDFGLVKLIDDVGPGLTSSRSMLGTPAAMAPEQLRGGTVDARTDVYALGLLAYHMLTGVPAYGGGPGVVQSYLQLHTPRPRPSSKVDLDPAIDEPIARALAPDPDERFASTLELLAGLRRAIEPSSVSPTTEIDVLALYIEGRPEMISTVTDLATGVGMRVALSAPDSFLAVISRHAANPHVVAQLRTTLEMLVVNSSNPTRIALGYTRATIEPQVDGPALDVESWALLPLPIGVWVGEGL
ncbi:MAG: serine/threonine-protein kinase [Proteobacteria bacterium]|nr:serine/threonine-protein kinase [Pseudomonadota bacterium]